MATVVVGADLCPIERNAAHFARGDAACVFGDLREEFQAADLAVVNLECPLIERPSPIRKTGPTFGERSACILGIKNGGIDVVNLANNHILDHGEEGLRNTMRVCAEAGIATVGAGENLRAARRILVHDLGGVRVGILSMAEHEFSIAGDATWGANPLDVIDFVRNVREHRQGVDYLIVLLHGGLEFHDYPSPRIQDTCRFLLEMGANAVFVQHAHCLGGWEKHGHGYVFYGQGAVVMDEAAFRSMKTFHEGYLVRLTLTGATGVDVELIPFRQSEGQPGARRMAGDEERHFRSELAGKSEAIKDPDFVRARWIEFCEERRHRYLSTVLGYGRLMRRLNAGGLLTRFLERKATMLGLRNVICCEAHREVLETLFLNRRS